MIKKWNLLKMCNPKIIEINHDKNISKLTKILEINNLCFDPPWSLTSLENEIQNKFSKYITAEINGEIIGYAGIWLIIDEAHITNIAVHPDFRGMGIGNKLLEKIISLCIINKIPSITLEVRKSNITAINLYDKFGFTKEGIRKNYYSNNEDAIIMWKRNFID